MPHKTVTQSSRANTQINPVQQPQTTGHEKARQQQFAAEEERKASHTADIGRQNVPIKQPNKITNNS